MQPVCGLGCQRHSDARQPFWGHLVLPENRIVPEQIFTPVDYFQLKHGRKGHLNILEPNELRMAVVPTARLQNPEGLVLDILRRDDAGDEDFTVRGNH